MNLKLIHTLSNAFGIKMHFCQSDSQWYYIFRPKSCRYIYICYRPFFKIFSTKVYFCRQIFHWFSIAVVITDKNPDPDDCTENYNALFFVVKKTTVESLQNPKTFWSQNFSSPLLSSFHQWPYIAAFWPFKCPLHLL